MPFPGAAGLHEHEAGGQAQAGPLVRVAQPRSFNCGTRWPSKCPITRASLTPGGSFPTCKLRSAARNHLTVARP
jgi:hypothetical protein